MSDDAAGPKVGQRVRINGKSLLVIAVGKRFATVAPQKSGAGRQYLEIKDWPRIAAEDRSAEPE